MLTISITLGFNLWKVNQGAFKDWQRFKDGLGLADCPIWMGHIQPNLSLLVFVWGSQTELQYSSVGLTYALYSLSLTEGEHSLKFLWMKLMVLLLTIRGTAIPWGCFAILSTVSGLSRMAVGPLNTHVHTYPPPVGRQPVANGLTPWGAGDDVDESDDD